jgi:hypothetical protein
MISNENTWRDIKNYENQYQVNELGNIRNKITLQLLKPNLSEKGYQVVYFRTLGIKRKKKVHRLVAEAFIPNLQNKPQINHIDGNKQNNNIHNLEWVTNLENYLHYLKYLKGELLCQTKHV